MRISFIGKFDKMYNEEYIAEGFEKLGHVVQRIEDSTPVEKICELFKDPDLVLWTKLRVDEPARLRDFCRKFKTACWIFDLYFGYTREYQLNHPAFTADYVFTTDGGHQKEFKALGINHFCVRQGIRNEECFMQGSLHRSGVVFVGTDNPYNPRRLEMVNAVKKIYPKFIWYGRGDSEEIRGLELNDLYGRTEIVIGDSVPSPSYWSNRIVETLGRGGFLIHPDVPGLKEEYPHLVTFPVGDFLTFQKLVQFYLKEDGLREELRIANFEFVRDNYTIDKKCAELLSHIR